MFHFNYQERIFILGFCVTFLFGASVNYLLKRYPSLYDALHLIDNEAIYPKVNVNTAQKEELVRVPYIGEYTAEQIVRYRKKHGPFQSIEDLVHVHGIREKNFKRFCAYLKI